MTALEENIPMTSSKISVDTNIIIEVTKGNNAILEKFFSFDDIFVSPIVLSELYFGAYRSANPVKNIKRIEAALPNSKLLIMTSKKLKALY